MIVRSCIIFIVVMFGNIMTGNSGEWTLERTIETALKASNTIAIEQVNAEKASLDDFNTEKAWYPAISFSAGANVVSDIMEITLPNKTIQFGGYDSYDMKLMVNQLLYDAGRVKELSKANQSRSKMYGYQAESARLATELQAKVAFYNVVFTEKSEKASQESIQEAHKHFHDVMNLYQQGMALTVDTLRAQLRVSNAEMVLISRRADIERAKATFRKVVGVDVNEEIVIDFADEFFEESIPVNYDQACQNRPEIKAFHMAVEVSDRLIKSSRAELYPSVVMFSAFNYGKPELNLPKNEWMHYFSGGLSLKWNVWDWGIRSREREKAELDKRKVIHNKNDFERSLGAQVSEAFTGYEESKARVKLAKESSEYARRSLDLISSSYREGISSETEYDNAHTIYTKAILEQSAAQVQVYMNKAYCEYVIGIRYSGREQ
jgi:outer membrane protein